MKYTAQAIIAIAAPAEVDALKAYFGIHWVYQVLKDEDEQPRHGLKYESNVMELRESKRAARDAWEAIKAAIDQLEAIGLPGEVASTQRGPRGKGFGQYLTCSQCKGRCTDHYDVDHQVWCPACKEAYEANSTQPEEDPGDESNQGVWDEPNPTQKPRMSMQCGQNPASEPSDSARMSMQADEEPTATGEVSWELARENGAPGF
jgi:hypothetical protein